MSLKPNVLEFQGFSLNLDEKVLVHYGKPVSLPPKAIDLLVTLAESHGHILEKRELLETVWPNTFVEEGNLAYTIRLLRKTLGDDAEAPKYIETIPRRGYRFIARVERKAGTFASKDQFDSDDLLVGRTKEIAELKELLGTQKVRLVTLTGPGGTGKTRLAKEVGSRVGELFPDGVLFVGLESVTDPSLVPTVIAHSLSVREGSWNDSTEALSNELRDRDSLLILDNFEQILAAAAFVARMLAETRLLKILVTSREPLRLKTENEYLVPPLSLPSKDTSESAFALGRYEAVEFFIDRARRVRSSFEVFEPDIRAIADICRRLDGLPLALELAAARAKVLSAPEILTKLEHGLALLTGGAKDLPNRQQTMRAAIAWSYDLLTDTEKEVFARLSIFEGGATFEAIEAVLWTDPDSGAGIELLDSVTSLCEKNLLIADGGSNGQRFRMLVVVREFAAECLKEIGAEVIARTHARYYTNLAEKAEPELHSGRVASWVDRLEREHDNVRAALKWSIISDHEFAARIAKSMRLFWMLHGYTREAQYWYRDVLKIKDIPSETRWHLLTGLANMTQFLGDSEGAQTAYQESLEVGLQVGDAKLITKAMRGLAGVLYTLRVFDEAKRLTLEALATSKGAGDDFGVAAALARLGDIALAKDDAVEARLRGAEALEIFQRLEFMPGVASKHMNLGMALIAVGDIKTGRENLRESLRIATEIGDYITTRLALEGMAFVCYEDGNYDDAAHLFGGSSRMGDEIGHSLEPAESRMRRLYLGKLKEKVGDAHFVKAYENGLRMDRSELLRLALGEAEHLATTIQFGERKAKRSV